MIADHRVVADLVPVDLPVNMMIAIAWHRACTKTTNSLSIYHSTTGGLNPFTWGEMGESLCHEFSVQTVREETQNWAVKYFLFRTAYCELKFFVQIHLSCILDES